MINEISLSLSLSLSPSLYTVRIPYYDRSNRLTISCPSFRSLFAAPFPRWTRAIPECWPAMTLPWLWNGEFQSWRDHAWCWMISIDFLEIFRRQGQISGFQHVTRSFSSRSPRNPSRFVMRVPTFGHQGLQGRQHQRLELKQLDFSWRCEGDRWKTLRTSGWPDADAYVHTQRRERERDR